LHPLFRRIGAQEDHDHRLVALGGDGPHTRGDLWVRRMVIIIPPTSRDRSWLPVPMACEIPAP